jgi:hypothetical protein
MVRRNTLALALPALSLIALGACSAAPAAKPTPPPPPPKATPATPQTGALFASVRDVLLPIGCYDAQKKAWGGGDACTTLVARGAQVAMEAGAPRSITGHDSPIEGCSLGPLLRTDGPSLGFAIYPTTARTSVRALPRRRGFGRGPATDALTADEKTKIEAQLKNADAVGAAPAIGLSATSVDVDGDGKDDRILVVRLAAAGAHPRFEWVGAVYVARSATGRVDLVAADEGAELEVRGTLDVDQDGVREIWYASTFVEEEGRNETITDGLAHLTPERVEVAGEVVTGGAGTCVAEFADTE